MAKKKQKPRAPRRLRMDRPRRLLAGKSWLAAYSGTHVVRSYARWFGVDWECALKELELLGLTLPPEYVQSVRRTLEIRKMQREREAAARSQEEDLLASASGEIACIVGCTAAGFPYGNAWEELEQAELEQPTLEGEFSDDPFFEHDCPAVPFPFPSRRKKKRP